MKLALLLPQMAPDLYDLAAMLQADQIILQDTEKWSRKSRVHRLRIRTAEGTQWINIPIRTDDRNRKIKDVRIDHRTDWIAPLLRSLHYNYRNSIYFDFYEPEIADWFKAGIDYENLMSFALFIQKHILGLLNLKVEYSLAGEMENYTSDPDELAKRLGAEILFQEHDSRNYQRQAEIKSEPNFEHPVYYQHFEGFEEGCCVLDMLFQSGPESFKIIDTLNVKC